VTIPTPIPTESSSTPLAKPAATSPSGLTTREVEVLRLLAQGLTDVQIAEQLVISPRTVNNHLTLIYSKIQVSSRSAATCYALEHHLVQPYSLRILSHGPRNPLNQFLAVGLQQLGLC
jgi:DNA-binding NarL/FixJ family response regulator